MNVAGKSALVVGMAKSGVACARLLAEEGARVTINDVKPAAELAGVLDALKDLSFADALGKDPMTLLDGCDLVVLSPGVSIEAPFAAEAKRRGIEVIGEIELGYRYARAPIVAITGNQRQNHDHGPHGELFKAQGVRTWVLGNIGIPIAAHARETRESDVIVAEVAGFQLESTQEFHAHSCAILNLTEDHLNRFGTMEHYGAAKAACCATKPKTTSVCSTPTTRSLPPWQRKRPAGCCGFPRRHEVENGAFVKNGRIVFRLDGVEQEVCGADELRIPGAHNLENALAAVAVALPVGVTPEAAARALRTFPGVEHRIEFVREAKGVRYINDSKGTNPDSTVKAVEAIKRPERCCCSAAPTKTATTAPVFRAFEGKVKAVVAYGFTRGQILRDAKKTGYQNIYVVDGSFEEAVEKARSLAEPGDDVLLSPACASYDMFDNFEQRGRVFKEIVSRF